MTSTRSLPGGPRRTAVPAAPRRRSAGLVLWLACIAGAVALVALGARALAAIPRGAPSGVKIVTVRGAREVRHER